MTDSPSPATSSKPDAGRAWGAITARIKRGDATSLEVYYEQFFDLMFVEARRLTTGDEAQCLDLVQDGMLKAMRHMKQLNTFGEVEAWTRVVIRSVALDFLRRRVREQRRNQNYVNNAEHHKVASSHVEDEARLHWVEEQLKHEPAQLKSILAYRYRFGWTLRAIGERMGMKPGAVDGQIRRALDRLRSAAKEQLADED